MTGPQFIASMLLFGFVCYTLYKVIAWGVAAGVESATSSGVSRITDAIKNSGVSNRDIERIITAIGKVTTATENNRIRV